MIIGIDPFHYNTAIWRVEPTGQFWNCDVAAVGRGAGVAERIFLKRILNWKRKQDKNDHNHDNRDINNNIVNDDDNDDDDDHDDWISNISNQDVKEYLHSLDCNDALSLATDIFSETLPNNPKSTTKHYPFENKNDLEQYLKLRDLQCIILTTNEKSTNVDYEGHTNRPNSLGSMQYLHNWEIWDRLRQKQDHENN